MAHCNIKSLVKNENFSYIVTNQLHLSKKGAVEFIHREINFSQNSICLLFFFSILFNFLIN